MKEDISKDAVIRRIFPIEIKESLLKINNKNESNFEVSTFVNHIHENMKRNEIIKSQIIEFSPMIKFKIDVGNT